MLFNQKSLLLLIYFHMFSKTNVIEKIPKIGLLGTYTYESYQFKNLYLFQY